MLRQLKCIKSAYITDKIIRGARRNEANTGKAGTVDLFKLFDISISGSVSGVIENSRALLKFDLDPLRALTGSILDYTHQSFKCELKMFDVHGGQTVPGNFDLVVHPLSRSWDEGSGHDIVYFSDIDSTNWITASYATTLSTWYSPGANKGGSPKSADIDFILSGTFGSGVVDAGGSQFFSEGTEDLAIDITRIVSATLAGIVPDHGFRIAFSGSQETDGKTRFVKRFASRHFFNELKQPRLIVRYNDSIQSNEAAFMFDVTGSLFMFNYDRNGAANILSGASATPITGANALLLTLYTTGTSGQVTRTFTASQHRVTSSYYITGTYSASFALSSFDSNFVPLINSSGSVKFLPVWRSLDGTSSFLTGSAFSVSRTTRGQSTLGSRRISVSVVGLSPQYSENDVARLRVNAQDNSSTPVLSRFPMKRRSVVFSHAYYAVRDIMTGINIIDFDKTYKSTLMSIDGDSMYFDLYMDSLHVGRQYTIDVLVVDANIDILYRDASPQFTII